MAEGDIEGEEKENFHFSLQHLEILSTALLNFFLLKLDTVLFI